ncbi:hypothetical protein Glove_99g356 [Diversispora epigaea]|uniref:PLAC8 family protein n=1 Tax=Diversispora epigaea TaxID=1348612 RepID=A0A397JEN0_9GLOM|nr:hypothetical protein Glove_99g356 [Diversispora epigaea]
MAYQPTTQMTQVTQMNIAAGTTPTSAPRPWKYGLCSCFDDLGLSIISCYLPFVTYAQNRTVIYPGASCFWNGVTYIALQHIGLCWVAGAENRGIIRARYNIEGSGCGDYMTHLCCTCCALVQETRELRG